MLNQMQFINGIAKGKYQLDSTVKLDDGRVVGKGTHEELMQACGVYREIWESQFGEG